MRLMILVFGLIAGITTAYAVEDLRPTAQEMRMLPQVCHLKLRGNNREQGMAIYGKQFGNVHHYCFALNWMNRYYRRVATPEAGRTLSAAILEFNYMVEHLDENGPLAGEIMMNRGIALMRADREPEALKDLNKALEYNPKLLKAYRELARYYGKHDMNDRALEILEAGMKQVPDSRSLKRLYKRYGGNPDALSKS